MRLENYGRNGDTEIRNVGGSPAHVNTWEAYMIDNYGKMGENITQASGSGTTNPRTGLKEYDWRYTDPLNLHHNPVGGWVGETWDEVFGVEGVLGNVSDILTGEQNIGEGLGSLWEDVGQAWDYTLGVEGLGGWFFPLGGSDWLSTDPSETTLMEREAGKVMGGAITNLQEQYQQVIGPGGTMKQQRDITEKGLGTKRDVAMQDIMGKRRGITNAGAGITSKSNLVLGEVQSDIDRQQDLLTSAGKVVGQEYKTGMETTALSYQKGRSDFVANLKKQMADLLISYQQATGEAYGGDWEETTSQWG